MDLKDRLAATDPETPPVWLATPIVGLGACIILFSLWILSYVVSTVYGVMNDPGHVPLVQFIMEKVNDQSGGISGSFDRKEFDIKLGEPVRYMMYLFVGSLIVSILANIFSGLISAGVRLVVIGMKVKGPNTSKNPDGMP